MEIFKRQRNCEEISPTKYLNEKKLKLNPNISTSINFDVDGFFDDCSFDVIDENTNNENQQPNSQDIEKKVDPKRWYRFRIKTYERDLKSFDVIIRLCDEINATEIICRLQGPWCQTKLNQNDIISVFPIWSNDFKCYVVNSSEGFLVTNPDNLISSTTVVGSLFCQRKAILQEKFRGIDGSNKMMVVGVIVHELFQTVLQRKIQSQDEILELAKHILNTKDVFLMLFSCKMGITEAEDEIAKFIPNIADFIKKYIIGRPYKITKDEFTDTIAQVQDIEENVWIPQLGLKGKIDVSVKIHRRKKDLLKKVGHNIILPLELKTGRASFSLEHKGQVILYQMMLQELGFHTDTGLLLYLRDGIMKEILSTRNEQRDLIILRNEINYYLVRAMEPEYINSKFQISGFPEPINHPTACSKCPYSTICSIFLKTDETIELPENHPFNKISSVVTEHLKPSHIDYFVHWYGIINLEQKEANKFDDINTLWIRSPEERMNQRKAIINLDMHSFIESIAGKFIHKFFHGKVTKNESEFDFRASGFSIGEYVLISTKKRISIAAGNICEISGITIAVSLERNLIEKYANESFIIDKYESKSGNIFNFTNIGLLLGNTHQVSFLRSIIVDKEPPTFVKKLPAILAREGRPILEELNNIQQTAVLKALSTDSYILVKGLPGTGKTQTLVAIIRLLYLLKKSVLITSHTHSAVDNVLIRLKKFGVPFIRLGSENRINQELLEYSESTKLRHCTTPEEIEKMYKSFSIVGVTCLGTSHSVFTEGTSYDVCIVDEATQVLQPTIIRPLLFAKKFILVGDPDQLPPLIRSKKARELGADESLFHRLDSSIATTLLSLQYRMNKIITKLANDLTYGDKLRCGNDGTMKACLNFTGLSSLLSKYSKQKWILKALEKHVDQSVIFLDTKDCQERSLNVSKGVGTLFEKEIIYGISEANCEGNIENTKQNELKCINYCEAAIVFTLVKAFIFGGYRGRNIGIIAPYRAQVQLLKKIQKEYEQENKGEEHSFDNLEINTVDQYQGRDKEIIIYSCTKTGCKDINKNNHSKSNEILEDRRRLTVAITRSKHKLIIVGDQNSLMGYTPFSDLLNKIPDKCKHILEDGKLGFAWSEILAEIKRVLNN